ncbi:MAG: signal peptidase I [Coriobacteriales bacterium]|nr:signal peptidase I [Coriobacteriales bacterium]
MRDLSISFGEKSPAKKQSNDGANARRRLVAPAQGQEEVQIAPTRARAQVPVRVAPKKALPWSMARATTPLILPVGKQQRQGFQITQGTEDVQGTGGLPGTAGVPGTGGQIAQGQPQLPWMGAAGWHTGWQQGAQGAGHLAGTYPVSSGSEHVAPAPPVVVTRTEPMIAPANVSVAGHVLVTPVVEVLGVAGVAVGGSGEAATGAGVGVGASVDGERLSDATEGFAAEGAPATPADVAIPAASDDPSSSTASPSGSRRDATTAFATLDEAPAVAAVTDINKAPAAAAVRSTDGAVGSGIANKIPLVVTDTDKTPAAASATGFDDLPVDAIAVADVDEMLAAVLASLGETSDSASSDLLQTATLATPTPAPVLTPEPAPEPAPTPTLSPASIPEPTPKPKSQPAKPRSRRRPWADPDEASDLFVTGAYEMPVPATAGPSVPWMPKTVPSPPVRPKKRARFDKTHAKDTPAADKQRAAHSKKERKTGTLQYIFVALRDVAIVLALFCILLQFFSPTVVREHSMENTLVGSDILFVASKAYWFGSPEHGDIVLFHTTLTTESGDEKTLVKRLIGLPGDRISINGGIVFRNGEPLDEPYLKEGITAGTMSEVVVPKGSYFVMGDNRAVSRDSRDSSVGFVKESQLRGKIVLRIFPLDQFRAF